MWKVVFIALFLVGCSGAQDKPSTDKLVIDFGSMQQENWTAQEKANVKLISDFVQNVMNNHNFEYVLETYNNDSYVQHNRNLPDGIAGLVGFLEEFVQEYPDYTYDVKHIYADGDYVVFHSHATLNGEDRGNDEKGMNIIDTWKVKDGKIVEHWDSIQGLDGFMRLYALISGGDIRNANGVF
jgi:predicted SnoaL-like aldol condensation-catalyzing enzyme